MGNIESLIRSVGVNIDRYRPAGGRGVVATLARSALVLHCLDLAAVEFHAGSLLPWPAPDY
jgi:hypothetical protein